MGKSVTAALFRSLGVPVFDSDAYVHQLLAVDAIDPIRSAFPAAYQSGTNSINRQILGQIIFNDKHAKKQLESILHPMIWHAQQQFIARHRRGGHRFVVLDIPLLFETGRDRICDMTICVTAPAFLQRRRVLSRKGMTSEKFEAILTTQMPDADKRRLADFTVNTGLGKAFTLQEIKRILRSDK